MENINFYFFHPTPNSITPPACAGFEAYLVQSWLRKQAECNLLMADICDSSRAGNVKGN